jgi:hypothetical protein
MSAADIIHELPALTDAERWAVMYRLRELVRDDIDLHDHPVNRPAQPKSSEVRERLRSVGEEWERPEGKLNQVS